MNSKIYIGKHETTDPNDEYLGSGLLLTKAINKYGKENFMKTVLYIFDNEKDMNDKESEIVNEEFILREDTYNIGLGGQGGKLMLNYKHSEETKMKIKKAALGSKKNLSEEQRRKRSEKTISIHTGAKRSEKTKEKMKFSQTGKIKSKSEKDKIKESVINSMPVYTCPICNKTGKGGAMKAYHFGKCKYNKT